MRAPWCEYNKMDQNNLENRIAQLENELKEFKRKYAVHNHSNIDGTNILRKNIMLDRDQWLAIGPGEFITSSSNIGQTSEVDDLAASVGPDSPLSGFLQKSRNMQMELLHFPNTGGVVSRLRIYANPYVVSLPGNSISTTSGGSTVTILGFNFITNELANTFIVITNSSGVIVETKTIASNTSTIITISGTWLNTTAGASFVIYRPVNIGDQTFIINRVYVGEDTGAGIRFGVGPTNGGQNGLLYMDTTGDLYWRDKAGTSTKLN